LAEIRGDESGWDAPNPLRNQILGPVAGPYPISTARRKAVKKFARAPLPDHVFTREC
jgi:hypothetical protein